MQQTDNLDLELYEATDNANLLDGYNASMRKLDQRDGEVSTLITGLNAAVTNAQSDATQALTDAATADGKAVTADGKATTAQTTIDIFKAQPYTLTSTNYEGLTTAGNAYSMKVDRYVIGQQGLQVYVVKGITSNVALQPWGGTSPISYADVFNKNTKAWPVAFDEFPAVFVTSDLTTTWVAILNDTESETGYETNNKSNIPGIEVFHIGNFQSNHDVHWTILAIGNYSL